MREDDFIRDYENVADSQTHDVSGNNEHDKDETYSSFMEPVKNARALSWKHFYKFYMKAHPTMTENNIDDMLIDIGIKDYNTEINTHCEDIDDVHISLKTELPNYSRDDIVNLLKDRGMMLVLQKEFKLQNVMEFLDHIGVELPDE